MRIDCPTCKAAYDVPLERLAAGRVVKCARCATTWTPPRPEVPPLEASAVEATDPTPDPEAAPAGAAEPARPDVPAPTVPPPPAPSPTAPPPPAPLPEVAKFESLAPPVPSRRSRAPLVVAWLLTVAVLAGLGWAAVDRRAAIMKVWPPSIRAYVAIGLAGPADDASVTKP